MKERNITGRGVKIAVFDSGLAEAYLTRANLPNGRNLNDITEGSELSDSFINRKLHGFLWSNDDSASENEEFLKEPMEQTLYEDEDEVGW